MKSILILDDEIGIRMSLSLAFKKTHQVYTASNSAEGLELMDQHEVDVCLLDLRLGQEDGVTVCKTIKDRFPGTEVILMTAYGSVQTAVDAMRSGAFNYLTKPVDLDELKVVIEKAMEHRSLNEKVRDLSQSLEDKYGVEGIVGETECMRQLFYRINRLKDMDTNVIIFGESGTGKELVAKALHYSGTRKKERFVAVNCAAIPANLLEEELFGHKRGSFTGASSNRVGRFEYAAGGTIFLDEIGEMPLELQAKLLRVLENREVTPLGSNEPVAVNARIVAATNRNLKEMVEQGSFRRDLYFRLHIVNLVVPPLRDRKEDIPLLIRHFLDRYNKKYGTQIQGVDKGALKRLMASNYSGNVRELFSLLEHAAIFCNGKEICLDDLPQEQKSGTDISGAGSWLLADVERTHILRCLEEHDNSVPMTARALGISDKGLRNKLEKYREY